MTQTIPSRKRSRDLEDSDLLPLPKRIDFNFNSSSRVSNHLNGVDEADGSSSSLQNGACYNGQPASAATQLHPHPQPPTAAQQATPPPLHQQMRHQVQPSPNLNGPRPDGWHSGSLDSSTCAALSNLHLMSGDQTEAAASSSASPSDVQHCDNSSYRDINRVLRDAHFSRLLRLNGTYAPQQL